MPKYRYRGALVKPLAPGADPTDKLRSLYEDLGVDPGGPSAPERALMALAHRHVPGFKEAPPKSVKRAKAGRKSAFEKQKSDTGGEFGPIWSLISNEVEKLNLVALVNNAYQKLRAPGGRRYTKKELVTKLSKEKAGPKPGVPNPYFGINPNTLLSWVTHAEPNSEVRWARDRLFAESATEVKAFFTEYDFEAKSKDTP